LKTDKWSIFKKKWVVQKMVRGVSRGVSQGVSRGSSPPGRPAHTLTYPWPGKIPCQLRSPKDIINPKITIFGEKEHTGKTAIRSHAQTHQRHLPDFTSEASTRKRHLPVSHVGEHRRLTCSVVGICLKRAAPDVSLGR
jgi:hypothetical protein